MLIGYTAICNKTGERIDFFACTNEKKPCAPTQWIDKNIGSHWNFKYFPNGRFRFTDLKAVFINQD